MPEPAKPNLRIVVPHQEPERPITPGEVLHRIQLMKARCAWEEIVRSFHPIEEKVPDAANWSEGSLILQEVAFALSQTKRYEEAIQVLLRCYELSSNSYHVAASIAFNYYNALMSDKSKEIRLGKDRSRYVEEAERWFSLAEELYPESVVDFYRHGMLYHQILEKKDHKAAILFERAIANWEALTPEERERRHKDHKNYIKALYHLAKARLRLGHYEEAEHVARKCLDEDRVTDHEEPIHKFYLLGKILMEAGRPEEALGHLKNAAHMRSKRPKDYIFFTLAECLTRVDRWEEALEWLERIPPRFTKPHMKRLAGWIHYRLGDYEKAAVLLDQALAEDTKGCHLTLVLMGKIFMDTKNWERAIDCFRQANDFKRREFLNDHLEALFGEAECLLELGNRDEALEIYRQILAIDGDNPKARQAISQLTGQEVPSPAELGAVPF